MTPNSYLYFDYYQTRDTDKEPLGIGGYVPFEAVYRYEPMSTQLTEAEQRLIRGVQANLWTEYITTPEHAEYMILPRLAALCEVQWSRPERKDYDSMMDRLPRMMRIYDRYGYNYAKHLLGVDAEFGVDLDTREVTAKLTTLGGAPIRYTLDGTDPATKGLAYGEPVRIASSATLAAVAERATPCEPSTYRVDYTRSTACPVTLLAEPHPSYRYAGGQLLADGLKGTDNFRTGRWIGFFDTDLVAVIDLGAPATIAQAAAQVCVHIGEGCFDARSFKVEVSNDGERYAEVAAEEYPAMADGDKKRRISPPDRLRARRGALREGDARLRARYSRLAQLGRRDAGIPLRGRDRHRVAGGTAATANGRSDLRVRSAFGTRFARRGANTDLYGTQHLL